MKIRLAYHTIETRNELGLGIRLSVTRHYRDDSPDTEVAVDYLDAAEAKALAAALNVQAGKAK